MNNNIITMDDVIEIQDALAEEVVALQYELFPDLVNRYGKRGHRHSVQDTKYHFGFLRAAVDTEDSELFLSYIRWVKVLLNGYNITTVEVTEHLITLQFLFVALGSILFGAS